MSIELAEKLKSKLTDQWVVVDSSVPELRRFSRSTGRVKTVNMNGRALVEFDNGVDIGWYDIDPAFLTIVDGPRPQAVPPVVAKPVSSVASAGVTMAPASTATAVTASSTTAASPAPAAGKPSPLDLIRKQQAAKKMAADPVNSPPAVTAPATAVAVPSVATPTIPTAVAPDSTTVAPVVGTAVPAEKPAGQGSPGGRPLSPIEKIRQMGAAKRP